MCTENGFCLGIPHISDKIFQILLAVSICQLHYKYCLYCSQKTSILFLSGHFSYFRKDFPATANKFHMTKSKLVDLNDNTFVTLYMLAESLYVWLISFADGSLFQRKNCCLLSLLSVICLILAGVVTALLIIFMSAEGEYNVCNKTKRI